VAKLRTTEEKLESRQEQIRQIRQKCEQFGLSSLDSEANLDEEREREPAPEVEEEQQVERPHHKAPAEHALHPDVRKFAVTGVLRRDSEAFMPAFESLSKTSANHASFPVEKFPKDLLVTKDFAATVKEETGDNSPIAYLDAYQRPVQWILTQRADESEGARYGAHMVIVSPFEANELVKIIRAKQKKLHRPVVLRAYLPRTSLSFHSLDDLTAYTVGESDEPPLPQELILQVNLFAGQTYLNSYAQYVSLARFLGLSYQRNERDADIPADAFVGRAAGWEECEFDTSPVGFLNVLFKRIRRDGRSMEKTHMGRILSGEILTWDDFKGSDPSLSAAVRAVEANEHGQDAEMPDVIVNEEMREVSVRMESNRGRKRSLELAQWT
jgi:hypothetical protein